MIKKIAVLIVLASFGMMNSAPATAALNANEQKRLASIEGYINGITTLVADFVQIAPDGTLSSGKFFLSRPGRFRWQYDPPVPILIVGNGKHMAHYDYELDSISHVSMDSGLAGIMAQRNVKLNDGELKVESFSESAGVSRVTVVKPKKPDEGKFTLVLNSYPLAIRQMEVIDNAGNITSISLKNIQTGKSIDSKLFQIDRAGKIRRGK